MMARLTLARKIVAITSIWKKGESFDPNSFIRQAARVSPVKRAFRLRILSGS